MSSHPRGTVDRVMGQGRIPRWAVSVRVAVRPALLEWARALSGIGKRFACAVAGSALEGRTPCPRAFRLLGLKRAATFDRLVELVGA